MALRFPSRRQEGSEGEREAGALCVVVFFWLLGCCPVALWWMEKEGDGGGEGGGGGRVRGGRGEEGRKPKMAGRFTATAALYAALY